MGSTVLVADDHPLFREALRGAVQRVRAGIGGRVARESADDDGHGLLDRRLRLRGIDAELARDRLDAGRVEMAEHLVGQVGHGGVLVGWMARG